MKENSTIEERRKRIGELEEAALPLLDYLNKHYGMHCHAIVSEGRVEVVVSQEASILPVRD